MVDVGVACSGAKTDLSMEAVRARWHYRFDARLPRIERWCVGLLIICLHALLVIALQRLLFGHAPLAGLEPAMQLVYVSWLPRVQEPPPTSVATPAVPVVGAPERMKRPHPAEEPSVMAHRAAPLDTPLNLSLAADDRWTSDIDGQVAKASAARTFRRRNPVPPPPTERFRMIDRSPAAIVRMISMGLFWPPGYSDAPCAGVNEAIDVFSRQATDERDRRLLADAVLQRSRYCPP